MHLGNGAVTPECGLLALGAAAAGVGVAWYTLRRSPISRDQALTAGALGAAVFAAQMLNVTILPFGSAHLVGGVLLAWLLRPALGLLTMAVILTIQAALLGDGGLLALGANIINMGVVPAALVAVARRTLGEASPSRAGATLGAVSLVSIVVAAVLVVGQVALFRSPAQLEGLGLFAAQMISTHVWIGVLEGGLTVALVMLLARSPQPAIDALSLSWRRSAAVGVAGLMLAVLCLPAVGLTSTLPDGYEAAVERADEAGLAVGSIESAEQLAGLSATVESVQSTLVSVLEDYELLVALMATLLAGAAAWMIATSHQSSAASRSENASVIESTTTSR